MRKILPSAVSTRVVFLLIGFILIGVGSCKKEWVPASDTTSAKNLSDSQKVHPDEVAAWIKSNLIPQYQEQLQLKSAVQNVINYQHVVRVPVGKNSALFFTKVNGNLEVFAYKWLDKNPGAKLYSGYIEAYSFQTQSAKQFVYDNANLVSVSTMQAKGNKVVLMSNKSALTKVFDTPAPQSVEVLDIFGRFWCWLTGGTYISPSDLDNGFSEGANGEVGATGCDYTTIQQPEDEGTENENGDNQLTQLEFVPYVPPNPGDGATGTNYGDGTVWVTTYIPNNSCTVDINGNQGFGNPSDGTCSDGQWETYPLSVPVNVIPTSILTNAYTKCVYNNLQNNTVYQGLINGFINNNTYNLILKVGTTKDPTAIAETQTDVAYTSNSVTTTFNQSLLSQKSIAELAESFLHEAYHAYIDLVLFQKTGVGKNVLNSTYANSFDQIVAYRIDSTRTAYAAKGIPIDIQQISHDVIAQDITKLGAGLQQFIETIYPAVKNDPLYTPTLYQNMMWAGLKDSQAFATTWGAPSTWGTNSNGTPLKLPPDVNTAFGLLIQIPSPCNVP